MQPNCVGFPSETTVTHSHLPSPSWDGLHSILALLSLVGSENSYCLISNPPICLIIISLRRPAISPNWTIPQVTKRRGRKPFNLVAPMEYNLNRVPRCKRTQYLTSPLYLALLFTFCSLLPQSALATCAGSSPMHHMNLRPNPEILRRQTSNTPLVITNQCRDSIYPGILTQSGGGPGTGGFGLAPGAQRVLTVGEAWQGRVWGRTNCSFNSVGDGPAGSTSNGQACGTGDCGGSLDCRGTVSQSIQNLAVDLAAHFWSLGRRSSQSRGIYAGHRQWSNFL